MGCASGSLDLQASVACSMSEKLSDPLHELLHPQGSWQTGHPTAMSQLFGSDLALSLVSAPATQQSPEVGGGS